MPQITGTLSVYSVNPRICRHDNRTTVCSKGYRISQLGFCLSQSLGKWNSTGFQPTYPLCFIDYTSLVDAKVFLKKDVVVLQAEQPVQKDPSFGSIVGTYVVFGTPQIIQAQSRAVLDSNQRWGTDNILLGPITTFKSVDILVSPVGSMGYLPVHQSGKNIIHHSAGVGSEYWVVDTYGTTALQQEWSRVCSSAPVLGADRVFGFSTTTTDSGIATLPYRAITGDFQLPEAFTLSSGTNADNPVRICVDDLVAPTVSGVEPLPGSHLNPAGSPVELTVSDSVAGVDIGVLKITVSGTITHQPEGVVVVSSGTDQTGGKVSIYGDILEYTVRYTPTSAWAPGERVRVTVSGQDLEPAVGAVPWTCYTPGTRNTFNTVYDFYVAATNDIGVSIVALPDTDPPYLINQFPAPFSRDNSVFGSVSFDVVDAVAGVNLQALFVVIDGQAVVIGGVRQTSEVVVVPVDHGFSVLYTPVLPFTYGREVCVQVEATDLYSLAPNTISTEYFFSTIDWGSLLIQDVRPVSGYSLLADTAVVSARVTDTTCGILDTYVVLNGTTYSGIRTPVYGNMAVCTAISGTGTVCTPLIAGAVVSGCTISGTTVSGSQFTGGTVHQGNVTAGYVAVLDTPFSTVSGTVVSGTIVTGTVISGSFGEALVSGTNWDGKYSDATVSGVYVSTVRIEEACVGETVVSGIMGYDVSVHPDNDFCFAEPIRTTIYGINKNEAAPVIRNEVFTLYYGYRLLENKYEMRHGERVSVFARAVNTELLRNALSESYSFTVGPAPYKDLPVSIVVRVPWQDLGAAVDVLSPTHSYGETIEVELYIEDKAGNALGPYIFQYTIEDR